MTWIRCHLPLEHVISGRVNFEHGMRSEDSKRLETKNLHVTIERLQCHMSCYVDMPTECHDTIFKQWTAEARIINSERSAEKIGVLDRFGRSKAEVKGHPAMDDTGEHGTRRNHGNHYWWHYMFWKYCFGCRQTLRCVFQKSVNVWQSCLSQWWLDIMSHKI